MTISISPFFRPSRVSLASGVGHQPRQAADAHRPAAEPLAEGREVLPCEQGGGADQRHLAPAHGGDESGAKRDLGLAEADVAADQPVHRLAGGEVFQHVADGVQLIVGLFVREAGAEFVEQAVRRLDRLGGLQRACGGDGDQALGHLAQPFLGAGLTRLPAGAAQAVELDAVALGAVAGQQVDVLHRQVELTIGRVVDFQAVVGRVLDGEGLQALVAADAVVDVDHQVALGQGRRLGQEVGGAPAAARPRDRRSPRMSVSEITARLSVSKPPSSGSTTRSSFFGSAALAACQ